MNTEKPWWESFFSGVAVDFWLAATTDEQTQAEADFIENMLQAPSHAKLLDVPCGGGRHSLALAARGYRVTGIDISAGFLAAARSAAAERQLPITWEQREMRDLPWEREFDGAFCFGNSFGYLDEDGNAAFLQAVSRVLKPGARFVLDAPAVVEALLPSFQDRGWFQFGDILFLANRRYDHVQSRVEIEYTFVRDGTMDTRPASQRIYTYRELCRLLDAAGFTSVEAYSSLAREPFSLGAKGLLLCATKN